MNVLWHKIGADLFEHKARSLLAVLSMAAGLFAVGSLFGMIDLQLSAMDQAHRDAIPSHINLILQKPIDEELVRQVAEVTGVQAVEPMNQLSVRYRIGSDGDWTLGTLVMRSDFARQRFDRTDLVDGRWPGQGRLAVERLSARAGHLALGDTVVFDMPKGPQSFEIGGIVRHPFVKPPAFGGPLHFFADAATLESFGLPQGHFRQLLIRIDGDYDETRVRQIARDIRSRLSQAGVGVSAALLQDPERHWGRPFVAGINQVLQIMALTSLALGALLILTTTTAHIVQQIDQIGIMKSLGGGRGAILQIYLWETLLLGLAAVVISLPAGVIAAWAGSRWFLDLFNIPMDSFRFSVRAIVIVVFGGLLTPLIAALGPILQGASLSVREAIASYGVGADFGSSRFDRLVDFIGARLLPTLHAAALGNLFRRKGRLALTQLALIVAGVTFLVVMSLISSLNRTLDNELARTGYAIRIGLAADQPAERIRAIAATLPEITGYELWSRTPVELSLGDAALRYGGTLGGQVVGMPATSRMYRPLIVAGRWLQADDENQPVLVLNAETALLNHIEIGKTVNASFPGKPPGGWKVIGLYRWITASDYAVEPIYAPLSALRQAAGLGERTSQMLGTVAADSLAEEHDLAARLKTRFEQESIPLDVYATHTRLEQRQYARNQFLPAVAMLLGLASMMATVGGIGLAGALSISVMQRRREIGVLRAIGARSRTLFGLFMLEGLLQALLAWAISVPLAWALAEPLARQLGQILLKIDLDYTFNGSAAWIWLAAAAVLAILASVGPALSATRLSVRECLAYS